MVHANIIEGIFYLRQSLSTGVEGGMSTSYKCCIQSRQPRIRPLTKVRTMRSSHKRTNPLLLCTIAKYSIIAGGVSSPSKLYISHPTYSTLQLTNLTNSSSTHALPISAPRALTH